jgi:hypothetical protein
MKYGDYDVIGMVEVDESGRGLGTKLIIEAFNYSKKGLVLFIPDVADKAVIHIFKKLGAKQDNDFLVLSK